MLQTILISISTFFLGVSFGLRIQTTRLKKKEAELNELFMDIKKTNNSMLSHIAEAYAIACGTEGEFTEIDEKIAQMYMDVN